MIEFYPQIKAVHIAFVLSSGLLFALRGLLVQWGRPGMAQATPVRWLGYAIDTCLLTAALMLVAILPHGMFANGWLATKLVLVIVYIALAMLSMKSTSMVRRHVYYVLALLIYLTIIGIALQHHPLGWLWLWLH